MYNAMNEVERRVLENVDLDGMIDYLCELVSVQSHGGDETEAQENVAAKLGSLGFQVDRWEIDIEELRRHPDFSMSIEREKPLGVVGVLRGEGSGRSLVLNGHVDTVTPGDEANWTHNPFEGTVQDGRVYGRGACDMKGGISCGLYAVKAIVDAGVALEGDLIFESVVGEEDGGCGTLAACLRGYRADAGIVMEPSEAKLAPEVAGAMSFRVTVPGKSVHACVREEGVSAVDKFILLHEGLRELERERNKGVDNPLYARYGTPFAINVGTINGGQWAGTVPESVAFEGRIGVSVGESRKHAREALESKVRELSEGDPWLRENRPVVDWAGYSFAPSSIPVGHPVVQTLEGAFKDATGKDPVMEGMTYASDVRHLINVAETPTMVFGPGDVRVAHGSDEYVPIGDLEATVRTLALTIMRFVGYRD